MSSLPTTARLSAAKSRFAGFFREIGEAFAEREDVIAQLALALLSREHVLLAGPPGTAKSALAGAVLGRILDEETGRPSLYARQVTESTVQTDVIGPIDFKTLMETGRTSHFTDEGLLGAVHAFLDEVFDGRDMLLRSTLNLLHERELKQGTQITRGRFEVAVMTTNRYVAEVLESARETLLAFVDRIAFIGFVPRGFAAPAGLSAVLRHEIGGVSRPALEAPLTVQDLDALQVLTDSVHISDPICDGLAKLLELFEAELAAAERADPSFLPTRYLSTRTAVRSGSILRALCVSDAIFRRPDRPLEVEPSDLHGLRLHLLLCGPTPHEVTARFAKERDVREKRQLSILQTEREAFERAYAKLPTIRIPRRRPAPAPEKGEQAPSAPAKEDAASVSERTSTAQSSPPPASPEPSRPPWAVTAENALTIGTPAAIASAMREVAPHARAHGEDFALAESLLRRGIEKLERHALAVTIEARTGDQARTTDVARDVLDLAQALDQGPAKAQALARWVRGRALVIVSTSAPMALDLGQLNVVAWESERDAMALLRDAEGKISSLEKLAEERARMVAAGVDAGLRHEADAAWHTGLTVVFEEITVLCDSALRSAATAALKADPTRGLRQILGDVGAVLELLRDLEARAVQLGLSASLRTTVIGPRLAPLLAHTFGRIDADDRRGYIAEVERARSVLAGAGLADVVPVGHWLTWAAHALLRAEASAKHDEAHAVSHDGYRSLRMAESRVPCGFVLAEVALRTAPTSPARASLPPQAADGLNTDSDQGSGLPLVASLLTALPDAQRRDIAAADKARVERILSFLEKFWASVEGPVGIESRAIAESQLRVLVESRFFAIALDEGAVLRTKLEIDLLRDLFPEEQDAAVALHGRVDALVGRARRRVLSLVKLRGEAEWSEALAKAGAAGSRA